jgi:hypothetical protein
MEVMEASFNISRRLIGGIEKFYLLKGRRSYPSIHSGQGAPRQRWWKGKMWEPVGMWIMVSVACMGGGLPPRGYFGRQNIDRTWLRFFGVSPLAKPWVEPAHDDETVMNGAPLVVYMSGHPPAVE